MTDMLAAPCKRGKHWFAVHAQYAKEAIAEEHLIRQEYEVYLPRIKETKKRRGVKYEVIVSLFPRYLFIRLDLSKDNIAPIRSTRGAIGLVRCGLTPIALPDQLVEALKASEDEVTGLHVIQKERLSPGDQVVVKDGPFVGSKAIFKAKNGQDRVLILMSLLGNLTPTVLAEELIERVS